MSEAFNEQHVLVVEETSIIFNPQDSFEDQLEVCQEVGVLVLPRAGGRASCWARGFRRGRLQRASYYGVVALLLDGVPFLDLSGEWVLAS